MFSRLSLLWKILIPTSLVMTLAFAITGWLVERAVVNTTYASVEQEAKGSFHAYESLWKARADLLASVSEILSTMSDVRAAFSTRDQATIRDTAGELWSKVSSEDAFFLVSDGRGRLIASLGAPASLVPNDDLPLVRSALSHFPKQVSGVFQKNDQLFQLVITPVYVQSNGGPALLNVLLAGYKVGRSVVQRLKESTGGSEYVFVSDGRAVTSTLGPDATAAIMPRLLRDPKGSDVPGYLALSNPLLDITGAPVGQLFILRSLAGAQLRLAALRRQMFALWLLALLAALAVTYLVARKIMRPVAALDHAAAEISKQNYDYQIDVDTQDELGRLAETFQSMCESIRQAREELIRQERISTIARLSTSIVHDLRNPLAAIYAGAEMLVDGNLPPDQTRRLARNIYRASRVIQDMLQQLLDVCRGKSSGGEVCGLREVVLAAWTSVMPGSDTRGIELVTDVPQELECRLERARMERVFCNLFENAIEAMPLGGKISVAAIVEDGGVVVQVDDTGPGVSPAVRGRLFQPFVTAGKDNGLGLGLALSRQTMLDHGGDMWADSNGPGARFCLRLPIVKTDVYRESNGVATLSS